jgi:hypothetical protein
LVSLGQLVPEFCQLLLGGLQGLLQGWQLSLDLVTRPTELSQLSLCISDPRLEIG